MIVTTQGAVRVNEWQEVLRHPDVVVGAIDLHSKYCEIMATGGSPDGLDIHLIAGPEALHLDETKPHDSWTTLHFPEFKDWELWCSQCSRYTLTVCFIKQ